MANNDYTSQRELLEKEIKELESLRTEITKPELPTVTLDEKEYTPPTDAQLKNAAESELAEYKTRNEQAIAAKNAADADALAAQRKAAEKQLGEQISALDEAYRSAAQRVDNDVLKRGLARSSIAVNSKERLEGEYLGKAANVRAELGGKIADLDGQIAATGDKLKAALNDFNLTYAAKLNDKLASLKAEREKKIDEVLEYNNKIKAEQAALDAEREKTESKLYSDAIEQRKKANSLDYLSDGERDEIYKSVFNKLDAFLGSLSAKEAKHEIQSFPVYRDHLSNKYFYMLYDKYGR